jgi:hypothetical protein
MPLTLEGDRCLYLYTGKRSELGSLTFVDRTPPLKPLTNGSKDAHANADRSAFQPNTIYYTTGTARPSQAFISTDAGKTWIDVTANLDTDKADPDTHNVPPDLDFNKLIGNPKNDLSGNLKDLFLATSAGVYRTNSEGKWKPYSEGLRSNEEVQDIVINSDHKSPATLYIATKGRGFWQRIVGPQ